MSLRIRCTELPGNCFRAAILSPAMTRSSGRPSTPASADVLRTALRSFTRALEVSSGLAICLSSRRRCPSCDEDCADPALAHRPVEDKQRASSDPPAGRLGIPASIVLPDSVHQHHWLDGTGPASQHRVMSETAPDRLSNNGPPLDDDVPPWGRDGIGNYFEWAAAKKQAFDASYDIAMMRVRCAEAL